MENDVAMAREGMDRWCWSLDPAATVKWSWEQAGVAHSPDRLWAGKWLFENQYPCTGCAGKVCRPGFLTQCGWGVTPAAWPGVTGDEGLCARA